MQIQRPSFRRSLWWVALMIAVGAAIAIYFVKQDPGIINADQIISGITLAAMVGVGICVICATSQWWLHR